MYTCITKCYTHQYTNNLKKYYTCINKQQKQIRLFFWLIISELKINTNF